MLDERSIGVGTRSGADPEEPQSKSMPDILLVDDNPTNLRLLQNMLDAKGYTLRPVLEGKHALEAVRAAAPDLILLDINMPEMNGYEVCEQLKADPELREIPVIFLSALHEVRDKVKGFVAGGVDYITKPFQIEEVIARVETQLELLQRRRDLKNSLEALQRSEALRDGLTHMVVHDLRSPLQLIIFYLDMLRSDPLPSYIDKCYKGAEQMIEMINVMLDIGKMESGAMELERTECDFAGLVGNIVEEFRPLSSARIIHQQPGQVVKVSIDCKVMSRVVQNLLTNAIRFAKSAIDITVSTNGSNALFEIQDDGPGVPPEYQAKIFDKYGQVQGAARKTGTGLGLTFCKLAVEHHGGQIGVISEQGKGGFFWFTVPLQSS